MDKKVLLYYKFVEVASPENEVTTHIEMCQKIGLTGRILIGKEGINGTVEGSGGQLKQYKNYLNSHSVFSNISFKETPSGGGEVFKKMKVKARDEIVTLNQKVDLSKRGEKISAEELHHALEKEEDLVLIDMRNAYESEIGKFKNAVTVKTENFRDLPGEVKSLEEFKDKKVVTYCTGGVRCEKASALLVENGFKNVYQLDGGIFKYVEKYPNGFFEGKCFVFDNRMSLDFNKSNHSKILAKCELCEKEADTYIDCANVTCHRLFIACPVCQNKFQNFCKDELKTKAETRNFTSPQN